MPWHKPDGTELTPGLGFMLNDIWYPENILDVWSHEDLLAIGLTWSEPPPEVPDYAMIAMSALVRSDITVIRCYEEAIPVPAEWVAFRQALRAVVRGESITIPDRPEWPGADENPA